MKKVTANDYRPGRTKTALSNGVESSLSSIGRKDSVDKKDEGEGEDVYGISHLGTEEELQALVSAQCLSFFILLSRCLELFIYDLIFVIFMIYMIC